jgi:hypothetical protein
MKNHLFAISGFFLSLTFLMSSPGVPMDIGIGPQGAPSGGAISKRVMVVTVKRRDDGKGQQIYSKINVIEKIIVQPGRLNDQRKKSIVGIIPPSKRGTNLRLKVLNPVGQSLYETQFIYPKILTVPPPPPQSNPDNIPPLIEIDQPEVTVVIPYFSESDSIQVIDPDEKIPPASKSVGEALFLNLSSEFKERKGPSAAPSNQGIFNVLIMASGYNTSDMNIFSDRANSLRNTLLGAEPFASYAARLAITIYQNTADLGCYSGCYNIDRLLCCNGEAVISTAAASGYQYDEIIVIHNTSTYAGGGYRDLGSYKTNSYSTYAAVYSGSWMETMALHEFGHSFGDLCDEYSYGSEGYTYYDCTNCRSSCNDWRTYDSVCQTGCDAMPSYFRPENSVMVSLIYNTYNQPSIKARHAPDGLELRLQYFTKTPDAMPWLLLLMGN